MRGGSVSQNVSRQLRGKRVDVACLNGGIKAWTDQGGSHRMNSCPA
ncbi:MAG: hypothetical protein AB1461_17355 [Thermodesulfobacteriota bacterium]